MWNSYRHYINSRDCKFTEISNSYTQLFTHKQTSALLRSNDLVENILITQLTLNTPFAHHLNYCSIDLFDENFHFLKQSICNFIDCALTVSDYNFGLKTYIDFKLPGHNLPMRVSIGNLIANTKYPLNPFTGKYMPTVILDEQLKLYLVVKTMVSIILPASIDRGVEKGGEAKAIVRHNFLPDYSDKIIEALLNSEHNNKLYSLFDDNKYLDISGNFILDIITKAKSSPYAKEFEYITKDLVLFIQQEHVSFSQALYEKVKSSKNET